MLKKFLNPSPQQPQTDWALLLLRISISFLLARHGYDKFIDLLGGATEFPDPLHVGGQFSLILTVFAEFFCSIFLALGLFTRIALIPLIVLMLVIVFILNAGAPLNDREEALLFLLPFLFLFLTGPGNISFDALLFRKH